MICGGSERPLEALKLVSVTVEPRRHEVQIHNRPLHLSYRLGATKAAPFVAGAQIQPAPAPGSPEAPQEGVRLHRLLPQQGKFDDWPIVLALC